MLILCRVPVEPVAEASAEASATAEAGATAVRKKRPYKDRHFGFKYASLSCCICDAHSLQICSERTWTDTPGTARPAPWCKFPAKCRVCLSILLHLRCSVFAECLLARSLRPGPRLPARKGLIKVNIMVSSTPLYPVASAMLILCRFVPSELGQTHPEQPVLLPGANSPQNTEYASLSCCICDVQSLQICA